MASFRPFPPQTSFAPRPNQNSFPPPPSQRHPPQFNQNWEYSSGDRSIPSVTASSTFPQNYNNEMPTLNFHYAASRAQQPPPQYPYPQPSPPPLETSYPPPPPPSQHPQNPVHPQQPPMHYPSSAQYSHSQYSQQSMQQPLQPPTPPPPPPPSSLPPSSSIPPPPPPSSPPPQRKESGPDRGLYKRDKGAAREVLGATTRHEHGHLIHGVSNKQQQQPLAPVPAKKSNWPSGRVETEEERRLRKKEFEKQKQQQLKDSQNSVLQKTHMLSSGKGHGSIVGSRMGEWRTTPLLTGERIENRLKKPTTFLGKLKFRNELPDPSAQPKLMSLRRENDQYTKYTITSLEKIYKPQLFVEPDLGIPLDLLDLSVYNPPSVRPPLAPEDKELLHDDELVTPIKKDGIRRKERPTDKGVSWLVKTQYISPLSTESTKQSLTEKQAKDLQEAKRGRNILESLNNRERQIKDIEASFQASKSHPLHASNKSLYPVEIFPLLPDFDRYDDQFVVASFDSAPTADSEIYSKLAPSVRDDHESRAVMKSYMVSGSDPAQPEKFLAYMVPSPNELSKDMYDEHKDISYTWVREYHWDVRGDDADDPTTYLVSFDEIEARYAPLPSKLVLRKKRAKDGKSTDEVEHFPVPSSVTVRQRPTVSTIELREPEVYANPKRGASSSKIVGLDIEEGLERPLKHGRHQAIDQFSEAEDDLSD